MKKRRNSAPAAIPEKLTVWQIDIFRTGIPVLNAPPAEHWRAWRDSDEARAAWRHHRDSLLRGEADPAGWWAHRRFDLHQTAEEIDREQQDSYFREMTAYREQQQALLDTMARKLGAARRRERGGAGEDVQ